MLQFPFQFSKPGQSLRRGERRRDRQRQFETRLARSFAQMRARKQTA